MSELIQHVQTSVDLACKNKSGISSEVLNMEGMSSAKIRHLLNNICRRKNTYHLEIGSWKGSTTVSALYNNEDYVEYAICIDNFMEQNISRRADKHVFFKNTRKLLKQQPKFYDMDMIDQHSIALIKDENPNFKASVYFYDGCHGEAYQYGAFYLYDELLDDTFIAIVDDWNDKSTRSGTNRAFER